MCAQSTPSTYGARTLNEADTRNHLVTRILLSQNSVKGIGIKLKKEFWPGHPEYRDALPAHPLQVPVERALLVAVPRQKAQDPARDCLRLRPPSGVYFCVQLASSQEATPSRVSVSGACVQCVERVPAFQRVVAPLSGPLSSLRG